MNYLDIKALGNLARELRLQSKLSQSEVAGLIGSSQPNVSSVEKGQDTRYISVAINIIQELSNYRLEGPFYRIQEQRDERDQSYK